MTREEAIIAILGRYRTQTVYRASRSSAPNRYAVFTGKAIRITEPAKFAEAEAERRRLIARDVVALYEGAK